MWFTSLSNLVPKLPFGNAPPRNFVARSRPLRRKPARCQPTLEPLEDRCVLSSYGIIDLGFDDGYRALYAVNNSGQIAAKSGAALLIQNGVTTDLGNLG